ncbi:MAG: ankyrin repeat domain-containing protein [Actinomycetota bacterium]|nr:ankyrin repeat domain-containing protein [Actinomycetota bacterium]
MAESPAEPDPDLVELATRLFGLARQGATTELAAYLDAGVSADLTNQRGDSLLMLAAYHGHAPAVKALLVRGADPDRANDRGQTPLAGAVFKAEPEVIRVLVAAGADPEAGQPSARATAAMFEREDLAELLQGDRHL